jgi:hypothetical protein
VDNDQRPTRRWLFVPLWGIAVYFFYAPRRVQCPKDGVVVEHIPWSQGKRPLTTAMMGFLARWARRLLWVGRRRTKAALRRGLAPLGPVVVQGLRFVCSDMWKPLTISGATNR